MKIAVLFDGAGLARLGLEQAGHECLGIEKDWRKHEMSLYVGSGSCCLGDVLDFDYSDFDAVWASPPCQGRSSSRTQGDPISKFYGDYLKFCLSLTNKILWVENVIDRLRGNNSWGRTYNANQFLLDPIQNRQRLIGGHYPLPKVFRPYNTGIPGICPAITATEDKGGAFDGRRASRFYGRKITPIEAAYHQGFTIPNEWVQFPKYLILDAIGNGVPVYMARAFGEAIK